MKGISENSNRAESPQRPPCPQDASERGQRHQRGLGSQKPPRNERTVKAGGGQAAWTGLGATTISSEAGRGTKRPPASVCRGPRPLPTTSHPQDIRGFVTWPDSKRRLHRQRHVRTVRVLVSSVEGHQGRGDGRGLGHSGAGPSPPREGQRPCAAPCEWPLCFRTVRLLRSPARLSGTLPGLLVPCTASVTAATQQVLLGNDGELRR